MNSKEFLVEQLSHTRRIIEWTLTLFPEERLWEEPSHESQKNTPEGMESFFGKWSALRVLFHLLYYEETVALPSLKFWIGGSPPSYPAPSEEEEKWRNCANKTELIERFRKVREKQMEVIQKIDLTEWESEKLTYYGHGKVSPKWFTAKTIQHTFSHGDKLLRKALYWDDF
jgi:hypothetical protein